MANQIEVYTCPHCKKVIAKHDRRNGANVFPTKVFKIVNGNMLVWCKTCRKYIALDFNPLSL